MFKYLELTCIDKSIFLTVLMYTGYSQYWWLISQICSVSLSSIKTPATKLWQGNAESSGLLFLLTLSPGTFCLPWAAYKNMKFIRRSDAKVKLAFLFSTDQKISHRGIHWEVAGSCFRADKSCGIRSVHRWLMPVSEAFHDTGVSIRANLIHRRPVQFHEGTIFVPPKLANRITVQKEDVEGLQLSQGEHN